MHVNYKLNQNNNLSFANMEYTATVLDVIDIVGIIYGVLDIRDQYNFLSVSACVYNDSKCFRYLKLTSQSSQLFYHKDVTLRGIIL